MKNNLEIIDIQSNNSKNGFSKTINLEIHGMNYEYTFIKSYNCWMLTNVSWIQSQSFQLFTHIMILINFVKMLLTLKKENN